jgi:PAS domain S-box-containing protein
MKLGYAVSDLLGSPLTKLIHPGDSEKLKEMLLVSAAKATEAHRVEFRLMRRDGGAIHVAAELRTQPQRGKQIPVTRILARDISTTREIKHKGRSVLPPPPAVAVPAAPARPAAAPDAPADLAGTEKLLVVDDTPDQREIAARMLAKLGYKVVTAEHGRAAIELMKQAGGDTSGGKSPFDLVLLDMTMEKDFDGLDTYRQMVSLFPGQRCIIISGGGKTDRVRKAQELGAGQFVEKPYTFRIIGKALRDELSRKA